MDRESVSSSSSSSGKFRVDLKSNRILIEVLQSCDYYHIGSKCYKGKMCILQPNGEWLAKADGRNQFANAPIKQA